jgi:hypothetical protein
LSELSFRIPAWSAWAPGQRAATASVGAGERPDPGFKGSSDVTPPILRRRVSALGQQALKAAWSVSATASARMIFCSRHGEFGRTLSILDSLVDRTQVSPADFTLSVHNALVGLLSIAGANRQGHTMITAGEESFGFGMLEALCCLLERPEETVLLVYFDEPLPAPFDVFDHAPADPIALAIVLTAADGNRFTLNTSPANSLKRSREPAATAFLRVMLGVSREAIVSGEQLAWHWRGEDAAA